jgi:hypothetical protein
MLRDLLEEALVFRSELIGDVYSFVANHSVKELQFRTRQTLLDASSRGGTFTRGSYRRTLVGMLRYMSEHEALPGSTLCRHHYVTINVTAEQDLIFQNLSTFSPEGWTPCSGNNSFVFECQIQEMTVFLLALVLTASQEVLLFKVNGENFNAYTKNKVNYNYLLDELECYVHLQTPAVTPLVTRYESLRFISLQQHCFDNFVSLIISYTSLSGIHAAPGSTTRAQGRISLNQQTFTTVQMLLAVQCMRALVQGALEVHLDEINAIDRLNEMLPALQAHM